MEIVLVVVYTYALAWAIVRGTEAAGRAVRDGYRRRVDAWRNRTRRRGNPTAGRRLAAVAGAVVYGTPAAARAFRQGWRDEWPQAKERAETRWRRDPVEEPDWSQDWPDGSDAAETGPAPDEPQPPTAQGPGRQLTEPTNSKEKPVAEESLFNVEVTSIPALIAQLEKIAKQQVAETDDALAASQRAKVDLEAWENVGLASNDLLDQDPETLALVEAMSEPLYQAADATLRAAAAKESLHKAAQQALDTLVARHGAMQEAHANAPHASRREAYAGV